MQNISYIITFIAILVLLVSGAVWWNASRQPKLTNGAGPLEQDSGRANLAAIATVAAFGLSLAAAILAMISSLNLAPN
jgi:uncharacterized iron-regulated membrane protein